MLAKPLLVFSSYSLLFALLAIRVEDWQLRWPLIALSALGILTLIVILRLDSRSTPVVRTVASIDRPGPEAGGYLVSYLLPFVVSPAPSVTDVISYSLFLILAGVITAYTGAVQINPLLYLIGRPIVRMTDTNGMTTFVVLRGRPIPGDQISVTLMNDVAVMRNPQR